MTKDFLTLLGGFLTALLGFFTVIGIKFDWFTASSIDAFMVVVGAAIALGVNVYAIWKNTYVSKKALEQKEVLKQNNLK